MTTGGDLFDQGGTGKRKILTGHDKTGFNVRDGSIRQGELELEVQVRDVPNPTQHRRRPDPPGVVNGQAIETGNLDMIITMFPQQLFNELFAFFHREDHGLGGIVTNGNNQSVEKCLSAFDDVEVTVGHRVKRAGENANFFGSSHA